MSISEQAAKAIKQEIGNLEDNAYRYRHIGRTPDNVATAERLDRKAADLRAELERLSP